MFYNQAERADTLDYRRPNLTTESAGVQIQADVTLLLNK